MSDQAWAFVDKSAWPPGPWQQEPDKVQWIDAASDLDCLAVRQRRLGHWCGYVGVPREHPLYGVDMHRAGRILTAHGGITFSEPCSEDDPLQGVCHVPLPGRPADVFWLGFDCGHAWDLSPAISRSIPNERYRDLGYVREQCRLLAMQLAALREAPVSEMLALVSEPTWESEEA